MFHFTGSQRLEEFCVNTTPTKLVVLQSVLEILTVAYESSHTHTHTYHSSLKVQHKSLFLVRQIGSLVIFPFRHGLIQPILFHTFQALTHAVLCNILFFFLRTQYFSQNILYLLGILRYYSTF